MKEIRVNQKVEVERTIEEKDINKFAEISGDLNPIHIDEEYAKKTIFKTRIAHGMFIGSLISAIIGMKLPGEGAIYLSQNFNFLKPVKIGDIVKAIVEIESIDKKIVVLKTYVINQKGDKVLDGRATVMLSK